MPTKVTKPAPKKAAEKPAPSKALAIPPESPRQLAARIKPVAEEIDPAILEKALIGGDIGALATPQRLQLIMAICRSLSLNHLTRPFEFTQIDGKWMIYARKDCTEQLRRRDCITVKITGRKTEDGVHVVTALAILPSGREDEAIGAVPMAEPDHVWEWSKDRGAKVPVENPIAGHLLPPVARAKAMMLAETKAKRRVTLSIAGLGIPDESELDFVHETPTGPSAEDQEKAANAKVIANGGTVEQFAESSSSPVLSATPDAKKAKKSDDWQNVECHLGEANGCWLGKTVAEIVPKAFDLLMTSRIAKMPEKPTKKEAILRDACRARALAESVGEWKWTPKTPIEIPASSSAPVTPPEPQKPASGAPERGNDPLTLDVEAEKLPPKPMEWRSVVVNLPQSKALHGKNLGDIAKAKKGEIKNPTASEQQQALAAASSGNDWLRGLYLKGIPAIEGKVGFEALETRDKILINAIRAATAEMKPFDDKEWIASLDEADLRREIIRRFSEIGMGEIAIDAALVSASILEAGETVATSGEKMLRYIIESWETVATAIEGAK